VERSRTSGAPLRKSFALHRIRDTSVRGGNQRARQHEFAPVRLLRPLTSAVTGASD
jgi:hypothetical protein